MSSTVDPFTAALTVAGTLGEYPWRVEVRPRRSTLGVSYDPDGRIVLAIPPTLSPERLVRAVRSRKTTILSHHFAARDQAPHHAVKELVAGEGFDWLSRPARLRITDTPGPVCRDQDGHGQWMVANRADLEQHGAQPLIDWYTREGAQWTVERMADWLPRLRITEPAKVIVRILAGGRWGSYLPASRTVVLHWPLFQLPRHLVEYVLVRQLVQATGATTAGDFRRAMDRVLPHSWEQQRELADRGRYVWTGDTR